MSTQKNQTTDLLSPQNGTTPDRLSTVISAPTAEAIAKLTAETGSNRRYIVERAIALYAYVHEETQRGRRIHSVDPSADEPPHSVVLLQPRHTQMLLPRHLPVPYEPSGEVAPERSVHVALPDVTITDHQVSSEPAGTVTSRGERSYTIGDQAVLALRGPTRGNDKRVVRSR